jgi:hypothetical protein
VIWITIGLHDTVQTVIRKESKGLGYSYLKGGPLYERVHVNRVLMARE